MRARQPRHLVPGDLAAFFTAGNDGPAKGEILHVLRIKMDVAAVFAGQALENLGKDALGSMATVYEGRNDSEAQVSESSGARV